MMEMLENKSIKIMRISGMTYEQASRRAEKVISEMYSTGSWHDDLDELIELRRIMRITDSVNDTESAI